MSDLISRQAAIDALDKTCDITCQYSKKQRDVMCGACPLGSAFDAIEDLPSVEAVPKWIPVTERLPEMNEWVLCHRNKPIKINVSRLVYIGGEIHWEDTSLRFNDFVTAWMPLPEPYKERTDEKTD